MRRLVFHVPGEEGCESKGGVQRRVGVRACRRVNLPAAPEPVEGVEQAGAHEAYEAEEDDLGRRARVDPEDALRSAQVVFRLMLGRALLAWL